MESSNFYTSSIWDGWYCWKSGTQNKRRNVCCTVAIRLGWKMVGWFYGLLMLSAKYPIHPGRRANSLWKAIWRTIQKATNSIWISGWISTDFRARSIKTSPSWQESFTRESFLGMHWSRAEFGKETFWLRIWKNWKSWTDQKFILEESMQKQYWYHKREKNLYSQ